VTSCCTSRTWCPPAKQSSATFDGVTFEAFVGNDEKRTAVERQLFVIGEAAARMSPEWKDARPAVPWRQIVGLRNLLAHGY